MAAKMTLRILRKRAYRPGDTLELEVNGVVQTERISITPPGRERTGYGFGSQDQTAYGISQGLSYGQGLYGRGRYGQGVDVLVHVTLRSFVAGDYAVRLRSVDRLGNQSTWSDAKTVQHRPNPPPPRELEIEGSTLTWVWTDP